MDPTHFLAGRNLPTTSSFDPVQEFYDTHATDPFRPLRITVARVAALCAGIANRKRQDAGFAVTQPAK